MCGIFFVRGSYQPEDVVHRSLNLIPRGPDQTTVMIDKETVMSFNRLRINDLSDEGNQPMYADEVYLLCNGEIYNCQNLNQTENLECNSTSDCETVLRLYLKYKKQYVDAPHTVAYHLLNALDGEFAFVIYDKSLNICTIGRDPYGVRPLFIFTNDGSLGIASEMKALHGLGTNIQQFPPGNYGIYNIDTKSMSYRSYLGMPDEFVLDDFNTILDNIRSKFIDAVKKRLMSERPVCSLLSGGLDSSLVASIVARQIYPQKLKTFCIGIEGSTDLYYANKVAEYIGSEHHVIQVSEQDFLDAIEETIHTIESYDITTVRASVGNLLVSKYISNNTDCKVVFNGDYSDEVCGGYLYLKKAPTENDFHNECCRLVSDICYFDSLRSDRTISSQGLEARVPFSDKEFVRYYLSIPPVLRESHPKHGRIEKYLLRKAFEMDDLLPYEVLFRVKEAFSDGVSKPERSWHHVIQEFIERHVSDDEYKQNREKYLHNTPPTKEAYYYRKIFENKYPNEAQVIPYFWMPKWSLVTDPSARELQEYKNE